MNLRLSIYEARTKFSELMRFVSQASQDNSVIVTSKGEPIVRFIKYKPEEKTLEDRLERLIQEGRAKKCKSSLTIELENNTVKAKAGALKRFLADR